MGGTFIRASELPSMMKGPQHINHNGEDYLIVMVDNRPASRKARDDGILGPVEGQFGLDVPTHIGNAPYVVTLPTYTQDYRDLLSNDDFGRDLDNWAGKPIALFHQEVVEKGPKGDAVKHYLRFRPGVEVMPNPPKQGQLEGAPKQEGWTTPKVKTKARED